MFTLLMFMVFAQPVPVEQMGPPTPDCMDQIEAQMQMIQFQVEEMQDFYLPDIVDYPPDLDDLNEEH